METISVIIPIYGVERYLDRCVKSVVNQTFQNLEIILVDDGSIDSCPLICDEWAQKDSRIKVIHKRNGGLSDARNSGLAICTGDYVGFVDSDDYINPKMYEVLYNIICQNHADIAECQFKKTLKENENETLSEVDLADCDIFSNYDAILELINDGKMKQVVWNKLYKRKVLQDVAFPFGKTNEDEFWTYKVFYNCKSLVSINTPLYYYFQRNCSIIGAPFSLRRLDAIEALEERTAFLKNIQEKLYETSTADLANSYLFFFQKLCANNHLDKDRSVRYGLLAGYKKIDRRVIGELLPKKQVFWHKLFYLFPFLTSFIRNILKIGL